MNASVFISTTGSGLSQAECHECRWKVEELLPEHLVNCLATDPHDPRRIYAGTQGNGLLLSDDCGRTWQPLGMAGQIIKSIVVSLAEPGLMFAGTRPPAVFVSHDGGTRWRELESFRQMRQPSWKTPTEPEPYVLGLAASPTDPNVVVAGVEAGAVLRSSDGGVTWQGHLTGTARDCHSLTFHATDAFGEPCIEPGKADHSRAALGTDVRRC